MCYLSVLDNVDLTAKLCKNLHSLEGAQGMHVHYAYIYFYANQHNASCFAWA